MAGSGKSVFTDTLHGFISTAYYDERYRRDGVHVVLVQCNLPAMQNPLSQLLSSSIDTCLCFV